MCDESKIREIANNIQNELRNIGTFTGCYSVRTTTNENLYVVFTFINGNLFGKVGLNDTDSRYDYKLDFSAPFLGDELLNDDAEIIDISDIEDLVRLSFMVDWQYEHDDEIYSIRRDYLRAEKNKLKRKQAIKQLYDFRKYCDEHDWIRDIAAIDMAIKALKKNKKLKKKLKRKN